MRPVPYDLKNIWEGSVMVCEVVPGECWEIEFFADDSLEVERFISQGVASAEKADLDEILELFE